MNNIIQSDGKWRYRDYVLSALNDDVPYDRFVTEQLAGDELVDWRHVPAIHAGDSPAAHRHRVFAHGARPDARAESNIPLCYYGVLEDTVASRNSLLGLTLGCAQCHSHQVDPIPQRDYYN